MNVRGRDFLRKRPIVPVFSNQRRHQRIAAVLAAVLLSLCCAGALAEGPIDRKIYSNAAQTLKNMPEAARERTDSIVLGVPDLFGETNPFWVRTTGDQYLASLLYDELLFTSGDGEMGAGVATYAVSADGLTYTFTIKDKVVYTDGAPVTSDDFINALYLLLTPGFDGVYDITRAGVKGVGAYTSGESASIEGIQRVSDKSFSVTVTTANPNNIVYFAIPALRVSLFGDMRAPDSRDPSDKAGFFEDKLEAVRGVDATGMTYGQYALTSSKPGETASLTKNATYWRGVPYVGTVELKVIAVDEELDAILSGEVDIVSLMGSVKTVDEATEFETAFINVYTWEGDVLGYLGMDLTNPIFADQSVRKALTIGFNREQARRDTVERYGVVPGMLLFDSFDASCNLLGELYPYDPALATELLEEAGWEMGGDGVRHRGDTALSFAFYYNTPNPIMDKIVPRLLTDYEALGVDITAKAVSFEELVDLVDQGTCEMYFKARRLPTSAALAADLFTGESHLNQSGYQSERLDRILDWTSLESKSDRQSMLYENLFQELYVELPFIPLYRRSEMLLVNGRVMNMNVTSAHDITADLYRFFLVDTLEGQW